VDVGQIEDSLARLGDRFLDRVYTAAERAETQGNPAGLAARFAAKEATIKALRPTDQGIGWQTIEVLAGRGRQPEIRLSGAAADLAAIQGVTGLTVSLTHQRRHAAAIVIAQGAR
jgi:holo-[acyl-carrier protein] synthase